MVRYGMVIDLEKCIGCQACVIACKMENNVISSTPKEYNKNRRITWNRVITVFNEKESEFPNIDAMVLPILCNHCDDPPCVKVCPVGATDKNEDGIVIQRYDRCIGCKYCIIACPYGQRYFNYTKQEVKEYHNPDVPIRDLGIVEKCTFCIHRIKKAKAENKTIGTGTPDGVVPACTEACPVGTRVFGDLDDDESVISKLLANRRNFVLRPEEGTNPKVYYLT